MRMNWLVCLNAYLHGLKYIPCVHMWWFGVYEQQRGIAPSFYKRPHHALRHDFIDNNNAARRSSSRPSKLFQCYTIHVPATYTIVIRTCMCSEVSALLGVVIASQLHVTGVKWITFINIPINLWEQLQILIFITVIAFLLVFQTRFSTLRSCDYRVS